MLLDIYYSFCCIAPVSAESCSLAANESFTCDNGECINAEDFCDGTSQCEDESDELNTTCTSSMFYTSNSWLADKSVTSHEVFLY